MDTLSVVLAVALGVIALLSSVIAVIWFLIRYAFLPWLRTELSDPMQETLRQVKENSHKNKPPTIPDLIDDVKKIAIESARHSKEASLIAREAIEEIGALSRMFDGHLDWSQTEVDKMWDELKRKKDR